MRSYAKLLYVFFYIKLSGVVTCWACMAPLLTSPAPLLHPSCTSPHLSCASLTSPAPFLTPAAPLFPAPLQQKLEGFPKDTSNHFKTNAKLCKAFICFFLYKAIRCGYVLGLHGTSPDLSCTSPAPFLHLS